MFEDRDNRIWMGSSGLSYLEDDKVINFEKYQEYEEHKQTIKTQAQEIQVRKDHLNRKDELWLEQFRSIINERLADPDLYLPAGTYAITVTDDVGCSESMSVEIIDPAPLQLTSVIDQARTPSAPFIDLTVNGGTASYQYDWDYNGLGNFNDPEDFYPLESGVYVVFVEDANGCANTLTVEVLITSIDDVCQIEQAQIFPSLNDGNFTLTYGDCSAKKQLEIFERSGKLVFQETTRNNRIAIEISHELSGTYYLRITADQEVVIKPFVITKK